VNPLTAILLLTQSMVTADPTHVAIGTSWLLVVIETVGLALYVAGFLLMAWALITLGHHYQLGGSAPRPEDKLVAAGPYRLVRHPMYTSALSIALGLAFLVQSLTVFGVFCIYVILLAQLIPVEEDTLRVAYGDQYGAYRGETKKLIPFVY
jgi:protein-S-isoprenylcysteine O-methyltransferase Ste14